MSFWKSPYHSIDAGGWTTVDHSLIQHRELLNTSGFPCKVLFRKTQGEVVGDAVDPVEIAVWDERSCNRAKRYGRKRAYH